METEQRTFFDENGNEVVVDVPKRKKRNNGGCLKWAVIIVGALFLLGFCGAMLVDSGDESDTEETTEEVAEQTEGAEEEISIEEYKSDATKITWIELADGDISGSTKVTFDGIAGESSEDGETLVVSDSDGIYYVRVPDDLEFEIEEGDEIIIWGIYVGDDKETGLPKIDTKIIEQPEEVEESTEATEPETLESEVEEEPKTEEVPREYQNALAAAQNYIDIMHFSEAGLYDQLTSEYGNQYPEDAARYALENVDVDYNEEALQAAESYQEVMPMSDDGLYNQLTSEYGEQFTDEQARYAIDNLN